MGQSEQRHILNGHADKAEKLIHAWISEMLRHKQNSNAYGRATLEITFSGGDPALLRFNDEVTHKFP